MTRVLFVIDCLGGGTGRVFLELIRGLDRRRFRPSLAYFYDRGELLDKLPSDVSAAPLASDRRSWRLDRFQAFGRLVARIRSEETALVVSGLETANIYASLVSRWVPRAKVLLCYHTNLTAYTRHTREIYRFFRLPMAWYVRHLYPWADAIVSPSRGAAEDLVETYGVPREKSRWIHNPVRVEPAVSRGKACAAPPWKDRTKRTLLAVGMERFVDHKGFDVLIHALAKLRGHGAPRLIIVGSGPQEDQVKQLVRTLGLEDRVWLAGYQPNPWAFAPHADLFVLSSRWETFGLVIVEAMAAGLPVLATDCPFGPSEIVHHGEDGWLVQPDEPEAMAQAIRLLLGRKPLLRALAAGGRKRARDFAPERVLPRYWDLFTEILEGTPQRRVP